MRSWPSVVGGVMVADVDEAVEGYPQYY